jgi:putative colanic acid biosynthesis acetyltransferase WcaF
MKIRLDKFQNRYVKKNVFLIVIWTIFHAVFFDTSIPWPSSFKRFLLILFGAKVGSKLVLKPRVTIKYPWNLFLGNNVWIGEKVWIDNLAKVEIKDNVCLSQGSLLLTGNHDYKKETFDLIVGEIILESGVWIGAKSIVCPSVTCHENSILAVSSVATSDLKTNTIYQGNPATIKRKRFD